MLNAGKASLEPAEDDTSFGSVRRAAGKSGNKRYTEAQTREAARKLHAWRALPQSPLRGILSILAGGGTFFAAHAADRVGRSCLMHKPMSLAAMEAAALARVKPAPAEAASDRPAKDSKGLFD